MHAQLIVMFFALVVAGCGSSVVAIREAPIATKSIPLQEAFREAQTIGRVAGQDITVARGQTPLVTLGKTDLLVVPAIIDESRPHILKVRSRVVRKEDGSHILFYPILSFVDKDFRIYQTAKPKYEFMFSENVLTNEFEIPSGVERVLIRTDDEFTHGSFVGLTSVSGGPSGGAYGVAGVLGGAIGGLILHAATQGETAIEFRFGEVGVISVEAY